ncbi:MAG: hypothetical protein ACTHK4_00170 [Mycobacteriales bacterium]
MREDRSGALADLDDRALPKVASALRRIGRATRAVAGPEGVVGRRVAPWVRREPVIAIALACVAFAAILIAVTGGDDKGTVAPPRDVGPRLAAGRPLGPVTGAMVSTYEAQASRRLAALSQLAGSQQLNAVVDFKDYVSAQEIEQLLAETPGIRVLRGFARVPPPQDADVHVLLTSADAGLSTALTLAQQSAGEVALHYERLLSRSITHPSTDLQTKVEAGAVRAAAARIDANGLGPTCGCVFSLVVAGPVAQLEQLSHQSAVRIVDPAPVGASLNSLMIVPLEPQITEKVKPIAFAGG